MSYRFGRVMPGISVIPVVVVCLLLLVSSSAFAAHLLAAPADGMAMESVPDSAQQSVVPAIDVSPTRGPEGTIVTVRGDGFPAGALVNIHLAGVVAAAGGDGESPHVYAAALADARGNMAVSFAMPQTWPDGAVIQDGTVVVVAATGDFRVQASALFDYVTATPTPTPAPQNPYAVVTPSFGEAGTLILVQGGGFTPGRQVHISLGRFDGQIQTHRPTRYAADFVNARGEYYLAFDMPSRWPDGTPIDRGLVLVLVQETDGDRQAGAVFYYTGAPPMATPTYTPTRTPLPAWTPLPTGTPTPSPTPTRPAAAGPYVDLQPNGGTAGTSVWAIGGGFPPRTRVNVQLAGVTAASGSDGAPVGYGSTVTDPMGNFALQFSMPLRWPGGDLIRSGTIAVVIATDDFATTATAAFEYAEAAATSSAWTGSYWDNERLQGRSVLTRTDPAVNFNWGTGSPAPQLPADYFSARWTREQYFEPGLYRFTVEVDDGVRLWVDGRTVIDNWAIGSRRTLQADLELTRGIHSLRMDYFEYTGQALARLNWTLRQPEPATPTPVPTTSPAPYKLLFDDDPRNNRRGANNYFCSGFESECDFGTCPVDYRVVWALYCRETDYSYVEPGRYRVTLYGSGSVRAGATDFGAYRSLYAFGEYRLTLPAAYTFCWPGLQAGGTGFETIVQSTGAFSRIDRIRIEYLGACR